MTATGSSDLARVFVEIADTLVDDFDLVEFLQMLSHHATQLSATHSAAVLLSDDQDRLHFMAASDEQVHLLELFQLSIGEGPCLDCFRFGAPVINSDLSRARARWPQFAPRATAMGLSSVHAFPLRLRGSVLGTMGLFGEQAVPIEQDTVAVLQAFADVATISILQERTVRRGEVLTTQLQGALNSRVTIEQAKGYIAQQYQVSVDAAFEMLRTYCRRNGSRLSQVALEFVNDPAHAPDLSPA